MKTKKVGESKLPAESKRFFPWFYYAGKHDRGERPHPTQIHKVRDGLAVIETLELFTDAGYRYGGSVLNIPAETRAKLKKGEVMLMKFRPAARDVIFLATRPPLREPGVHEKAPRKTVDRSSMPFEKSIFKELRRVFKTCRRNKIVLNKAMIADDPAVASEFEAVHFQQNKGGYIEKLTKSGRKIQSDAKHGVGYLVSISSVGRVGCRLLCSFSSGGTETLWHNHFLMADHRKIFTEALGRRGFICGCSPLSCRLLRPRCLPRLRRS